jgi:hypothetical protein
VTLSGKPAEKIVCLSLTSTLRLVDDTILEKQKNIAGDVHLCCSLHCLRILTNILRSFYDSNYRTDIR